MFEYYIVYYFITELTGVWSESTTHLLDKPEKKRIRKREDTSTVCQKIFLFD